MNEDHLQIWDEIYRCEFFEEDIKNNQMYVLIDKSEIVSAFVLCDTNIGEKEIKWMNDSRKAMYLDRLGVNVNYSHKGIGSLMINKAKEITQSLGKEYLRLFVVDTNIPAIHLYIKNGFKKAEGIYEEVFEDGFSLYEYGYEIKV